MVESVLTLAEAKNCACLLIRGDDAERTLIVSPYHFDQLLAQLQPQSRFTKISMPVRNLSLYGATVVADPAAPKGTVFGVSTNHFDWAKYENRMLMEPETEAQTIQRLDDRLMGKSQRIRIVEKWVRDAENNLVRELSNRIYGG